MATLTFTPAEEAKVRGWIEQEVLRQCSAGPIKPPPPADDPAWVTLLDVRPGDWTPEKIALVYRDAPRVAGKTSLETAFFWDEFHPINNGRGAFVPDAAFSGMWIDDEAARKARPAFNFNPLTLHGDYLAMHIQRATPEQMPALNPSGGAHMNYLTSVFTTRGTVQARYARTTTKMRLVNPGSGLHTSIWTLDVNKQWPPEIDHVEIDALNALNRYFHAALHLLRQEGYASNWQEVAGVLLTSWFDVTNDWTPTGIVYTINGVEFGRTNKSTDMLGYYLASNEMSPGGDGWHSGVDREAMTPNQMSVEIASIRIEQRKEHVNSDTLSPLLEQAA